MTIKSFQSLRTDDYELSRVQENVKKAFSNTTKDFVIGGNLLKDQSAVSTSNTSIDHGLGRIPNVWHVMPKASSIPYEISRNDKILVLRFSADCTFDIYIA